MLYIYIYILCDIDYAVYILHSEISILYVQLIDTV